MLTRQLACASVMGQCCADSPNAPPSHHVSSAGAIHIAALHSRHFGCPAILATEPRSLAAELRHVANPSNGRLPTPALLPVKPLFPLPACSASASNITRSAGGGPAGLTRQLVQHAIRLGNSVLHSDASTSFRAIARNPSLARQARAELDHQHRGSDVAGQPSLPI